MPQIPEQINKISLKLKANIYFDGGVVSHTIILEDGKRKTVGLIRKGEYHFTTDAPEQMDIIAGNARVKLEGERDWKTVSAGQTFNVSGKSSFNIAVDTGIMEYLCTFLT